MSEGYDPEMIEEEDSERLDQQNVEAVKSEKVDDAQVLHDMEAPPPQIPQLPTITQTLAAVRAASSGTASRAQMDGLKAFAKGASPADLKYVMKAELARFKETKRLREEHQAPTAFKAPRKISTINAHETAQHASQPAGPSHDFVASRGHDAMASTVDGQPQAVVTPVMISPAAVLVDQFTDQPDRLHMEPLVFSKKNQRIRVALSLSDDGGESFGNPFTTSNGYTVTLKIDGGITGKPRLAVKARFSKTNKQSGPPPDDDRKSNSAFIEWFPAEKSGEHRNMESFEFSSAAHDRDGVCIVPVAINQLCLKGKESSLERIVTITFKSGSRTSDGSYTPEWAKSLPVDIERRLNELFSPNGVRRITMWFLDPLGYDLQNQVKTRLLEPIQSAVQKG